MITRKPYSTDISDSQWEIFKPLIPSQKPGGRPRYVNMREIINAIFYILATGCPWRLMPHDLPPWATVYDYFRIWRIEGTWLKINQALPEQVRILVGKQSTPSAAIVDSASTARRKLEVTSSFRGGQSVKTTEIATEVGYDGGKLVKGHKRHILVDTLGLILTVIVTAANLGEKKGVILFLEEINSKFCRLEKIFADGGYQGTDFHDQIEENYCLDLEVVKRTQKKGFKVLP